MIPVDLSGRFTSEVAQGDLDNDGFADIVVADDELGGQSCQPVILRNLGNDNNWLTIRIEGTTSNRDAIGERVVVTADGITQSKGVHAGTSFISTESSWLTFGLASAASTDRIKVTWPSGLTEVFPNIAACQTVTLVEGQGSVETAGPELIGVVEALAILGFRRGATPVVSCAPPRSCG